LSFIFSVAAILLAEPTLRLILVGGAVSVLGVGLRAWAAGYLKKDQELSTGGPYAYTRNPLYLGSLLLGLGVIIACGSLWLLALFLILFYLLFSSAISREALHLHTLFPAQYPEYERAVPIFFPRLTPYPGAAPHHYSLALYKAHREYQVGLVLVLIFSLLLVKATVGHADTLSALAQNEPPKPAETEPPKPAPLRVDKPPFAEGETLQYEVRYSRLILSGKIGRITYTVTRSEEVPLVGHYLMKVEAVAEGFWPKILGLDISDLFESFIDPADFGVARTRKQLNEQGQKEFELAVFDRKNYTVMVIYRNLITNAPPEIKQAPTRPWVQDIVSATYYVRLAPLTVGQTLEFPLSDSGRTIGVEVKVVAQEPVQIGLGQFNTLKVQPLIFGEENLIRKPGEMYIWLTDDARHIPVRAMVQGSFGAVTVELTSMQGTNK
jgi:hypothetical protein